MSQTGTPTEFLKLGITEPDDTLNVLVDLNGQWQKIDTGVKNVDTKANTNASGISALNTAVQDNTENITNILETNVNQQTSIDTLQSKVATLEEDDTSYGTRITAVEAGVQENSELINDLEVGLSGVKTSVGTVPEGSNLQGEVNGLDTRVTALENSGSVAAVEARVTTLETEVGTVPAGETVQGQITTLNGQVNSGNIPFRFSVDGEGNYGYLKADDSFVPFRSGSDDSHWHVLDTTLYKEGLNSSFIVNYADATIQDSPHYCKMYDLIHDIVYTGTMFNSAIGAIVEKNSDTSTPTYCIANNGTLTPINNMAGVFYNTSNKKTYYLTKNGNSVQFNVLDEYGNSDGLSVNYTLHGTPTSIISFNQNGLIYKYNNDVYNVTMNVETGVATETINSYVSSSPNRYFINNKVGFASYYSFSDGQFPDLTNKVCFYQKDMFTKIGSNLYYYI